LCEAAPLDPLEIGVGRPTSDRAALSHVDRDGVVVDLPEELSRRRDPDTLDLLGGFARHDLNRVAGQAEGAFLAGFEGAVGGDISPVS
jgi:hypothetical protein